MRRPRERRTRRVIAGDSAFALVRRQEGGDGGSRRFKVESRRSGEGGWVVLTADYTDWGGVRNLETGTRNPEAGDWRERRNTRCRTPFG